MTHNRLSNFYGVYTIIQVVHTKFTKVVLTDYSALKKADITSVFKKDSKYHFGNTIKKADITPVFKKDNSFRKQLQAVNILPRASKIYERWYIQSNKRIFPCCLFKFTIWILKRQKQLPEVCCKKGVLKKGLQAYSFT